MRLRWLLSSGLLIGSSQALGQVDLFVPASGREAASLRSQRATDVTSQLLRINRDAVAPGRPGLRQPGSRLATPAATGISAPLVIDRVETRDEDAFAAVGHLEGFQDSVVVLAVVGETMAGTFTVPGQPPIRVCAVGDGLHELIPAVTPPGDWCGIGSLPAADPTLPLSDRDNGNTETVPDARARSGPTLAGTATESQEPPLIDILVLYTERAEFGAGGAEGIQALIDFAVAENNLCYANSGIHARWNIAGRERIARVESGSIAADLLWLMDNAGIAALKEEYRADLVMLMVEYDRYGYAGIANADSRGHGYTVFLRPWVASGLYVVPHEVGHLLGAGHDRLTCTQRLGRAGCGAFYPAFSYGHRFEVDGMTCRTVMAYEPGLGIPYFAGPKVRFRGVATGVAEGAANAADVVRTINLRAPVIARALEPTGRFGFIEETAEAAETSDAVTLHIRRTGSTNAPASVECYTLAGTAAPGEDFSPFASRITFPAGTAELAVTVPLFRDSGSVNAGEGDEYFDVRLRNPENGTALSTRRQVRVTLLDAQPWYRMEQPEIAVSEAELKATVVVQRGGELDAVAVVPFVVRPGTAEPGQDYEPGDGTLAFPPGVKEARVVVRLRPDLSAESDESLVVALGTPDRGGVVLREGTTAVTIVDDDRDGAMDAGFAVSNPLRPPTSLGGALVLPDGGVLVSGAPSFRQSPALVLRRLRPDGTADPAFQEVEFLAASALDPGTTAPAVLGLTVQPDGRILVAGEFATVNGRTIANLARLLPDGTLDESFTAAADSPCYSTAIQSDNRIVVGGSFLRMNGVERRYLARLQADGRLDPTFTAQANLDTIRVRGVALQGDGKVLVCGTFWGFEGLGRFYLARLHADGSLDRLFAARPDGIVSAVVVLPDQRILIAGGFNSPRSGLARLLADGSTDPSFDPGSLFNAPVRHVAPLIDGRLMVGGAFTSVGPARQNYLVRLLASGTLDPGFNPGRGPNDIVAGVAVQPDGAVIVHGYFSQMNQLDRPHLVRLRGPDLRLRLHALVVAGDGGVRWQLTGYPDASYVVEASTDLEQWTIVHQGQLTATEFQWDEKPPSGEAGSRFYRARLAP